MYGFNKQFNQTVFMKEIKLKALEGFTWVLEQLVSLIELLAEALTPNKHRLKARFTPSYKIVSKRKKGFNINGKNIDKKLSMQGVLINGETGSFKSSGVIVRSILTVDGSQIIHDPSRELFKLTSGALLKKGYQVLQLDFTNPEISLRFNPILRANTKSQITQLASNIVIINGEDKAEDSTFWNQKAIEVIYVLISILKTQELQYQNLCNVAYLLDLMQSKDSMQLVDQLFAGYAPNEELFQKYSSIISQSSNTLSSVLSTAQTAVQIFSLDEAIAEITATDTIGNFNQLRKEKTVLYIHSSTAKMRYYSKVTSIFLSQYFESFFEELPAKDDLDVFFHLDELPVLSISSLDVICSNIRKYRGAIMGVTQNAVAQLNARYGKRAEAIISNLRTKVYLSADLKTAESLERTLGKYNYVDKKDGDKLKSRSLLIADEIMSLPANKALVCVSGLRPSLVRITPYFKVRKLRELTAIPPFVSPIHTKGETIVLLPLQEMFPEKMNADE